MELNDKKIKSKIWLSLNFWFGVIGVIGFLFSIYTFAFPEKPELKYYVLANTSILDVKEKVNKLTVTYDSINILKSNQNISIIILEIKNIGTKNITLNDYDIKSTFGVKIVGGTLLKKPELLSSSDNTYFSNIISNFNNNQVKFNCKLIDQDQYFRIKFLILHSKKNRPNIEAIGKVSGMDKIEVLSNIKSLKEYSTKKLQVIKILTVSLFLIFLILIYIIKVTLQQKSSYVKLLLQEIESKNSQINILNEKKQNIKNALEFGDLEIPRSEKTMPNSLEKILTFEEAQKLKKGEYIFHERFGRGEILDIEIPKEIKNSKVQINFDTVGIKKLLLRFVSLYKIK